MLAKDLKALFTLYGEQFVNQFIERMNELDLNATGDAARNLRYKVTDLGFQITGNDYLRVVDDGRAAGKTPPPVKTGTLENWVATKVAPGLDERELRRLTFAISKTIGRKGTIKRFKYQGAGIIDFVIKQNDEPLTADLADLGLQYLDTQLTGAFKTHREIKIQ
jgi:hypothetical protein